MTTVVNKTKSKYDVYIGRPSIFGNPFKMNSEADRKEVIEKYRKYVYDKIKSDPKFLEKILELKGFRLGCFCKPAACHGDILVEIIEKYSKS